MLANDNAMLMVLSAPNETFNSRWVLSQAVYILGRDLACDICLPCRLVSRRHARLFHMTNGFFIEDLGSKNGTYINGEPITQAKPLYDGDVLQIGTTYRFSFVDKEETAPVTQQPKIAVLQLDPSRKQVRVDGQLIDPPLATAQFALLQLLLDAQGHLVSYETIAKTVWGTTQGVTNHTIDSLLVRLRRRLAEVSPDRTFLQTIRGKGVKINYF